MALGALLLAAVILLVACASFGPTSTPTSTTGSPAAVGSPTTGPSTPAGSLAPASPTDSPEPSVNRHGVPELEALLPTKVGDVALERLSLTGRDFLALGTDQSRAQLGTMLAGLGKGVDDLSIADAGDPTGIAVLEVGAFRISGADPTRLLAAWVASTQASKPGKITVSNVTVDGRALTRLVDASRPVGGVTYAFVKGDTLLLVAADDGGLLSSALVQLPTP